MGPATTHAPVYIPLRRVRPETLSGATAQTPGMARAEAIAGDLPELQVPLTQIHRHEAGD